MTPVYSGPVYPKRTVEYQTQQGQTLKGFSQTDLDIMNSNLETNNELLKKWLIVFIIFGVIGFLILLWIVWQVKYYRIVSQFIDALRL